MLEKYSETHWRVCKSNLIVFYSDLLLGLGEDALTWLDFEIVFKPNAPDGLLIYNGHRSDGYGDFMALYLIEQYVEFAFDLGTGASVVTSKYRISLGEWHKVIRNPS